MNPLIPTAMGYILPLLFFYKDGFGIKKPMKADMPLNKEKNGWFEFNVYPSQRPVTIPRVKNPACPTNNWVVGRKNGIMPFSRALVQSETQMASISIYIKIWNYLYKGR